MFKKLQNMFFALFAEIVCLWEEKGKGGGGGAFAGVFFDVIMEGYA